MKHYQTTTIVAAAALIAGYYVGSLSHTTSVSSPMLTPKITKQLRIDTIRSPTPHHKSANQLPADTIRLPLADSPADSAEIILPRQQKTYTDTTFTAWISGTNPSLDSIEIYPRTQTITIHAEPKTKKWHIGPIAGIGATSVGIKPFIGIGITYSIISF